MDLLGQRLSYNLLTANSQNWAAFVKDAEGTTEGRLSLRNDDRSDTWLYKFIIAFGRQLGTMYRVACFDMLSQS